MDSQIELNNSKGFSTSGHENRLASHDWINLTARWFSTQSHEHKRDYRAWFDLALDLDDVAATRVRAVIWSQMALESVLETWECLSLKHDAFMIASARALLMDGEQLIHHVVTQDDEALIDRMIRAHLAATICTFHSAVLMQGPVVCTVLLAQSAVSAASTPPDLDSGDALSVSFAAPDRAVIPGD